METINRHFDYIDHYERIAAREAAKAKPNQKVIACALGYVEHSRARIAILNAEYALRFYAAQADEMKN
jgi:hypothetical protein